MRALLLAFAVAFALIVAAAPALAQRAPFTPALEGSEASIAELPREARETIALIRHGGPYPYAKDGAVFGNREGRLPHQKRGYYREYTVKTPGLRSRGARRVIAGAGGEVYYTDDHYNHFRRVRE